MLSLVLKSSLAQQMIQNEAHALYQKRIEKEKEQALESRVMIADMSIGKPIIIIPDSDSPVTVGIITGFMQVDPQIPYVHDYVLDSEFICFTNYIAYSEQNLEAVMKLTPSERGGLFYRCHGHSEEGYKADSMGEKSLSLDEIKKAIDNNGFHEKAKEFWNK